MQGRFWKLWSGGGSKFARCGRKVAKAKDGRSFDTCLLDAGDDQRFVGSVPHCSSHPFPGPSL